MIVSIPKTVSVATAMFLSQNKNMKVHKTKIKQKQKTTTRTRFSVTTCPGGVLDIFLGREVRRGPSYPDPF